MRAKSATKRDKSKSKEHVVLGIINPLPNKNKHERKGQISPSNERVIGMQPDGVRIELTRQINRQAMKSARQRDVPLPADETYGEEGNKLAIRNIFSESALKKRTNEIRAILEDWRKRWTILQHNIKNWRRAYYTQIATLRAEYTNDSRNLANLLENAIYKRYQICLYLRSLAKGYYDLFCAKEVDLAVFNDHTTSMIDRYTRTLNEFLSLLEEFRSSHGSGRIQIARLVEFIERGRKGKRIIKCLKGLFNFLYYVKGIPELVFNVSSCQLEAKQEIYVEQEVLAYFLEQREQYSDAFTVMIRDFADEINSIYADIPYLTATGRQHIVECNLIAYKFLQLLSSCDCSQLYQLWLCYNCNFDNEASINAFNKDSVPRNFWHQYFQLDVEVSSLPMYSETEQQPRNYQHAFEDYQEMKTSLGSNKLLKASNKLESKLPIHSKSPVDYGKIQIQKQKPGSNAKEYSRVPRKVYEQQAKHKEEEIAKKSSINLDPSIILYSGSVTYPMSDKHYNSELSRTLQRIDSMEEYLAKLLRPI